MKHNKMGEATSPTGASQAASQHNAPVAPDGLQSEQHLALAGWTNRRSDDAVERLMKTESISIFTQNDQGGAGQGRARKTS